MTGAKLLGMMTPSAAFAHPCKVSMLEELVRPMMSFDFTRWRFISFSMPHRVNGCDEIAITSAFAFFMARTCWVKFVSASSHLEKPFTSNPASWARVSITLYQVKREWAKSSSTPP